MSSCDLRYNRLQRCGVPTVGEEVKFFFTLFDTVEEAPAFMDNLAEAGLQPLSVSAGRCVSNTPYRLFKRYSSH